MTTQVLSVLLVIIGLAMLVRTVAEGVGGGQGILLGVLFCALGAGRLFLSRRA